MPEIPASDFQQKCLSLLDDLPPDGLLITRDEQPVAQTMSVQRASCADLIGSIPSLVVDANDDLFSAS